MKNVRSYLLFRILFICASFFKYFQTEILFRRYLILFFIGMFLKWFRSIDPYGCNFYTEILSWKRAGRQLFQLNSLIGHFFSTQMTGHSFAADNYTPSVYNWKWSDSRGHSWAIQHFRGGFISSGSVNLRKSRAKQVHHESYLRCHENFSFFASLLSMLISLARIIQRRNAIFRYTLARYVKDLFLKSIRLESLVRIICRVSFIFE